MGNMFKFHTGVDMNLLDDITSKFIDKMRAYEYFAGIEELICKAYDKYPPIILINGVGGIGKSTFANMVINSDAIYKHKEKYDNYGLELSTIDPLRDVAYTLMEATNDKYAYLYKSMPRSARFHATTKSNVYRALLHDLKIAWEKFDDGPNRYVVSAAIDTLLPECIIVPKVIFINVREPENITKLKSMFRDLGLICFTLLIYSGKDTKEYSKLYGVDVSRYDYDVEVLNNGTLEDLDIKAKAFAAAIANANYIIGIPRKTEYQMMTDETC